MQNFHVTSGRASLSAVESGVSEGADVFVFLHAGVSDQRSWSETTANLTSHEKSVRTLTYDRRGFGSSSWAAERHSRVADLIAVMDHAGVASATLVGNSQGGRVALDAAHAHPERVTGLVLIAPAVSRAPSPKGFPPEVQRLNDAIEVAEEMGKPDVANELEAQLWLDGPASTAGRVSGERRNLFLEMNGIALRAEETGECTDDAFDTWSLLSSITTPTLVIVGDLDLPHLRERAEALYKLLPNARLAVVSGCAHLVAFEAPDRVVALIDAWLHPE
jgi:pimeloyl-ACP methyl ester carboxylesterase